MREHPVADTTRPTSASEGDAGTGARVLDAAASFRGMGRFAGVSRYAPSLPPLSLLPSSLRKDPLVPLDSDDSDPLEEAKELRD